MNNQNNPTIEFASFTLAEGVDEAALIAAADDLQKEFLSRQKGFIKRDLVRVADGKWADVIYWESRESVEQAMQSAPENPAALRYFQLMATAENGDPSDGLILMSVARSYS
jgi:heme-degrading monooxygenase HmoA